MFDLWLHFSTNERKGGKEITYGITNYDGEGSGRLFEGIHQSFLCDGEVKRSKRKNSCFQEREQMVDSQRCIGRTNQTREQLIGGGDEMKIFTDEFENVLVNVIGTSIVVSILLLIAGVVGGIEQGLLWR